MPRLMAQDDTQVMAIPGSGNFQFSAVRVGNLGASEYTLVTIACDVSSSVISFASSMDDCIKTIIKSCKENDRAENLLVRLITFSEKLTEVHGFLNLGDIDVDSYDPLRPYGFTALYDASYDAVGATLEYSKLLVSKDFSCNGAVYIITDGMNNRGTMTPISIREKLEQALKNEEIESIITILIGLIDPNDSYAKQIENHLKEFKDEAGLTEFLNVGEATPRKLAKLANWVSESVSSQSQSLVNGAPSQILSF